MLSKEQPKKPKNKDTDADLFPKPDMTADLFPGTSGTDANLFPDMSAVDTLQNVMTPPLGEINMTMKDDLKKPNLFLRLTGIQEGIDSTTKSPVFQEFNDLAKDLENSESWLARSTVAPQMREAAGQMMLGNVLFTVADYESRPRKALVNLVALRAQRGMDRVNNPRAAQTPLTKQDYVDAITRGWSGTQDMRMIPAVNAAISPQGEVNYQRWLTRHPRVAKVMNANEMVAETGIAILSEIAIAKGVGFVGKGLKSLTKINSFMGKAKVTDSVADFVTDTVHTGVRIEGASDATDAILRQFGNNQDAIDDAFRNAQFFTGKIVEGAKTPDDMIRGMIYRKYILDSIQTKTNPTGVIKQNDMQGLIKAATFDQKTMYNQLNLNELEDIAFEVEAIKLAPSKFRNNAVELIRRKSYGPPVNTFARLGLEHQYSNVMSGIYTRNEWYNQAALWLVDTKQQFKKQFNKTWDIDSKVDEAMSYAAEGVKYESLPDDILDEVTGEEFAFLLDKAIEDRDNFLDPLADIAEAQGKISSDPLQIAAGVPPRVENYYHRIHDDISGYMMKRIKDAEEAGRKISVPVDYDLDKLIREGHIPEGRDIGEWIARDATKDNYSRSYSRVRQVYAREVTHDLFARPEVVRLKAAIDALPVAGELRVTAKTAARKWSIQILNQPTSIDTTLNKAFNWTSRQMEKIIPKWEAQERSFENFSRFTSRRIDQGLLAGNPRPAIRNLFQPLLTTNIYGHRATLWGYQQLLTPGGKKLLGTSQVYLGRGVPLAAFDVTNAKSWTQLTYLGIKATDKYLNVATSYLAGWRYYFRRSPKAWDELVAFAKTQDITESSLRRGSTFSGTVADAVDAGMFREVRRTIDFRGIGNTQWHYDSASMPPSLTSSAGKLAGKYTSWTQYMWGAHMPQMMDQLVHGKDIFGMKASPAVRGALFGTAAKGLMLAALGNELGVNMSHLAVTGSLPETYVMGSRFPVPMSPVLTGGLGIGAMAIGALKMDSGYMDAGWKQFVRSSKAMIPLYGVGRQIERVRKGEQPAAGILWPLPKQKKDKDKAILKGVPSIKSIPSIPGFPGLSKGI